MNETFTVSPDEISKSNESPLDEGSKAQIKTELESKFGNTKRDVTENIDHYKKSSKEILNDIVLDFEQNVDTQEAESVNSLENNLGALKKLMDENAVSQITLDINTDSLCENLDFMKAEISEDLELNTPKDTEEAMDLIIGGKESSVNTVNKASTDFAATREARKNVWVRNIEDLYEESVQLSHRAGDEEKEKIQRYSNKLGNLVNRVYAAHSTISELEQDTFKRFQDSMLSLADSLDIIPETVYQNLS